MDLSRPLTHHHETCTQVWCGVKAENLLLRKTGGGKPQIYLKFEDSHQSEVCNFETATHINK